MDKRAKCLKEIAILKTAFDFYEDRINNYTEEALDDERETFFAKIATSLQNDSVLDDGAPQFMPPRAKKARTGATYETKGELLMMLNQTVRMHIGMSASRDPDMTAACVNLNQRADLVQQNPMGQFAELLSVCADDVLEKIVGILSGTNNAMKFDHLAKGLFKATFDLAQTRELQNMNMELSVNTLTQLMVTGAFANDSGLVNWAGDGNSVQCVVSAVLKEKCKRTGAAEADARRAAAEADGMPL